MNDTATSFEHERKASLSAVRGPEPDLVSGRIRRPQPEVEEVLPKPHDPFGRGETYAPVDPAPPKPHPMQARAELVATFTAWIGHELSPAHLLEAFAVSFPKLTRLGLAEITKVLTAQGLKADFASKSPIAPDSWPALVEMTNGQLVLVLSQDSGALIVHDSTQPDHTAQVPVADFAPFFSGRTLRARPSLAPQAASPSEKPKPKPSHWFWGEFRRQPRSLIDVGFGTGLTNILAMVVAGILLVVLDNTLTDSKTMGGALTAAAAALGLSAALEWLRNRMIDSAGGRLELSVQSRLMDRLLSMKKPAGTASPASLLQTRPEFRAVREFFMAPQIAGLADLPFVLLLAGLIWLIGGSILWAAVFAAGLTLAAGFGMRKTLPQLPKGVAVLGYLLILGLAFAALTKGALTLGGFGAIGVLSARLLAPLVTLPQTIGQWRKAKAAIATLDTGILAQDLKDLPKLQGNWKLSDIRLQSPQGTLTLELPKLSITAGERIAILGPHGSGKSQLLNLLAGQRLPDQGQVTLDGHPLPQISGPQLKRDIAYLTREPVLTGSTLRQNLTQFAPQASDETLHKALDFAGLHTFVAAHPKRLDMPLNGKAPELNESQRLALGLAQLWLQDPGLVLLDEPTAGLEPATEAALVKRLTEWLQGRTAVVATHRTSVLGLTERVLILQNGRLMIDGPREKVMGHLRQARKTLT